MAEDYFPGDVVLVPLSEKEREYDFYYQNNIITKIIEKNSPYLLFGIPYGTKPGIRYFTLKSGEKIKNIKIKINDKEFNTQYINFKKNNSKKVKIDYERIIEEKNKIVSARKIKFNHYPDYKFVTPTKGIVTGTYGTKRFYNGKEGRYHNGHDIAAAIGTKIIAPSSGKVILTGDYYYNGKFVMINHGNNLISIYLHMDKITVNIGDLVNKSQMLGTVGNTGRSTGPHLHWSVMLNNTYVDPLSLVND